MLYISYSKTEYDIGASKNIEILLVDSDQENIYRKYCKTIEGKTCL